MVLELEGAISILLDVYIALDEMIGGREREMIGVEGVELWRGGEGQRGEKRKLEGGNLLFEVWDRAVEDIVAIWRKRNVGQ